MFELRREIVVAAPRDEVWSFFCDARNLERLTPSFLRFEREKMQRRIFTTGERAA